MVQEMALEDLDPKVMKFFDENIESWANQTIIQDTKAVASAANMSDNYINSIKFIKTGFAKGKIVNTHPFAKIIENGSKPHIITTKGGPTARSPPRKLKLPEGGTGNRFPEIVNHPGTRPMLIMTKGRAMGLSRFIALSKNEMDNFKETDK